jgi:hypothetical protein
LVRGDSLTCTQTHHFRHHSFGVQKHVVKGSSSDNQLLNSHTAPKTFQAQIPNGAGVIANIFLSAAILEMANRDAGCGCVVIV